MNTPILSAAEFAPNSEGCFIGLANEAYHRAPGISSSMAKQWHAAPSPAHYQQERLERAEVGPSEAMVFGTLLHTAVLEPHRMAESFYLKPAEYPSDKGVKPWNGNAGWCKEWLAAHATRPVVTPERLEQVQAAANSARALPGFRNAFNVPSGVAEVSFFKKDPTTGHLLKARTDWFATDCYGDQWVFDLKTCRRGDGSPERFGKVCFELGYHIQAAAYLEITGASRFRFVVVENEAPYATAIYAPDAEFLELGLMHWRAAVDGLAQAMERNEWPGYSREVIPVSLPTWAIKKL